MELKPYIHKVHYYETDKMGITHHSNYIRWMEEARVDYLDQVGYPFSRIEEMGLLSPVLSVDCSYREVTRFDEEVAIYVRMAEFGPVKFTIAYKMVNVKTGHVVCTAESKHCIVDQSYRPVRLKRDYTEFYEKMCSLVCETFG